MPSIDLKARAQTAAMRKQVRDIQRALKDAGISAKGASDKTTKYGSTLTRLEAQAKSAKTGLDRMKKVLGAAGLVAAAVASTKALSAAADEAIRYRNVMANAEVDTRRAAQAVDHMTSQFELQRQANTLTNAEVKISSESYAKFAEVIAKLADNTGRELIPMMQAATESIIRGNIEGIAGLGIKFDSIKLQKEEAAALGKTVQELSLVEKRQIALNALITEGVRATKDYSEVNLGLAGDFVKTKNLIVDWTTALVTGQIASDTAKNSAIDFASELVAQGASYGTAASAAEEWRNELTLGEAFLNEDFLPTQLQVEQAIRDMTISTQNLNEELVDLRKNEVEAFDFASLGLVGGGPAIPRAEGFKAKPKKRGRGAEPATEGELLLAEAAREREAAAGIGQTEARQAQIDEELELIRGRNELELALEEERGQNILDARLRQIEEARELGADPIVMMEQEQEALLEHNELLQELNDDDVMRLQLTDDRRQIVHDANLKRMKVEASAERQRAKDQRALFNAVAGAAQTHASHIEEAARLAGRGQAAAHAVAMGIRGAVEVAEAAASFARYDFFAGAAHTAAAGLAFAAMGKAIAESGGVGGGGARAETLPQAVGGGAQGGPQPVAPDGGGGGTPISPGAPGTATQQSTRGGGGGNITVSQSFDGAIILDEVEFGQVTIRAIRAATEATGEIT